MLFYYKDNLPDEDTAETERHEIEDMKEDVVQDMEEQTTEEKDVDRSDFKWMDDNEDEEKQHNQVLKIK